MTIAQERAYRTRINEAIEAEHDWDRRNEAGEFDGMDDVEWEAAMRSVVHAVHVAKMAFYDAKIKTIRPDDWYRSFLGSFGAPPHDTEKELLKSVSPKQAQKLMEKGEYDRETGAYNFRCDGNVYTTKKTKYGGYSLTIRRQFL